MLHRVFVDSDVLAARTPYAWLALLRDETGSFQLHSSAGAVADSVRLWSRPESARRAAAPRRLELLVSSLDEVIGGVEPDLDLDAAVEPRRAAADATVAGAHLLVSARGGGGETGDPQSFEVYTPDEFLCLIDDTAYADVRHVTSGQLARRSPHAPESLTEALTAAGCPAFAERVSSHRHALAR